MTDYTKLIHALRECGERAICNDCPIFDTCDGDIDRAMHDAAAAIEELSKTVKDLTTKVECSPMQISEKAFDRAIEAWNRRENDEAD